MLHSKIVSCTATADAGQQSQMPSRKRRCYTAKSFPAQQRRMLDSKVRCRLGNADATQQNRFPAQQRRMLDSKVRCRPGNADATKQNRFLRSNGGCWTAK